MATRFAKGNDVKAWADEGLRDVLKRQWLSPGNLKTRRVSRLFWSKCGRSRCGVAESSVARGCTRGAASRLEQGEGEGAKIGTRLLLGGS